jgi:hypothetical protein
VSIGRRRPTSPFSVSLPPRACRCLRGAAASATDLAEGLPPNRISHALGAVEFGNLFGDFLEASAAGKIVRTDNYTRGIVAADEMTCECGVHVGGETKALGFGPGRIRDPRAQR